MRSFLGRIGSKTLRVAMLFGLLLISGTALGLAAAYPLTFFNYDDSSAVRLDQARLAGQVDVEQAVVSQDDLPKGWEPGDANLAGFGVLNSTFCGETVAPPTPLSEVHSAVFTDPTNDTLLIAQALHVDRWQSAKTYVNDVQDALSECSQFYRDGPAGQVRLDIKDASESPPIADDFVAATYVDSNGDGAQEWAIFAVGDVVIGILHSGPTRPDPPFMNDVIERVLARIDPSDFAPGGIAPTTTVAGDGSTPSTLDSGSADETETGGSESDQPVDQPASVPTTSIVTSGGGD